MQIPDYNFLSSDTTRSITDVASKVTQLQREGLALTQDQAKQRWSDILAANTDANGTINFPAARAAAAKDPLGMHGMMAGTTATSPLITDQNKQAAEHFGLVGQNIVGLIPNPSDDALEAARVRMKAQNLPNVDAEIDALKAMPSLAARRDALHQYGIGTLDAAGRLGRVEGTTTMGDYGDVKAPTQVIPGAPGQPPAAVVGAPITQGVSPDTRFGANVAGQEQTIGVDANGRPVPTSPDGAPLYQPHHYEQRTGPRGAIPGWTAAGGVGQGGQPAGLTDYAGRPLSSSLQNPNAAPGTPPGRNAPVTPAGTAPQAATPAPGAPATTTPQPPQTPQTPPAGAPGATPGATTVPAERRPFVITAPPQGQPEEVAAAVQHASDARARANNYQQTIQPIEGALTALAGADTGKGAETLQGLRARVQDLAPGFLQRMLPATLTDPEKRKAVDEAQKYLTQMQLTAPGGARSDVGTATAGAASPSIHISNAAAIEVTRAILAQRRMEQVGTQLFNQSGRPGMDYDRFMNDWATTVDPRAFVADKMSGPERAAMVKDMGGVGSPAYQQFRKNYEEAIQAKVIRHGTPSAAVTPAASPNLLAMAGAAPGNALAAA